jgi:hypothetical protein
MSSKPLARRISDEDALADFAARAKDPQIRALGEVLVDSDATILMSRRRWHGPLEHRNRLRRQRSDAKAREDLA